jgi:hypothetical protein
MPITKTFHVIITLVIIQDYYTPDATKEIKVSGDFTACIENMTEDDFNSEIDNVLFDHGLNEFPIQSIDYKVFNEKGEELV